MTTAAKFISNFLFALLLSYTATAQTAKDLERMKQQCDGFYFAGKYKEALEIGQKIEAWVRKDSGEHSVAYAIVCDQFMGMVYDAMDSFLVAEKWYKKAIALYQPTIYKDSIVCAEALTNLGSMYNGLGLHQSALPLLHRASPLLKNANPSITSGEGAVKNNLGICYQGLGQYSEAEHCYLDALAWLEKTKKTKTNFYATALNNLSAINTQMGNYKKALFYNDKALQLLGSRKENPTNKYLSVLGNKANILNLMHFYDSALAIYDSIISVRPKSSTTNMHYLSVLLNMSDIMRQKKQPQKAIDLLHEGLTKSKQLLGDTSLFYLIMLEKLCNLYIDEGKLTTADSILQLIPGNTREKYGSSHSIYIQHLVNTFNIRTMQRKYPAADTVVHELNNIMFSILSKSTIGFSEAEKLIFSEFVTKNLECTASLTMLTKERTGPLVTELLNQQLLLKGMVQNQQQAMLKTLQQSNDTAVQSAFTAWLHNRELLARQIVPIKKINGLNLDSLQYLIEDQEKRLSRLSPVPFSFSNSDARDITEIYSKLKKNEAAIEFIEFTYTDPNRRQPITMYAALLLNATYSGPVFIPLCRKEELLEFFPVGLSGLEAQNRLIQIQYVNFDGQKRIYNLLWKPVVPYLKGIKRIYFATAGLLQRINIAAIPVNAGSRLMHKYELRQVSGIRNLITKFLDSTLLPPAISLWGNINYNKPLPDSLQRTLAYGSAKPALPHLKWTKKEITSISNLATSRGINSSLYQEKNASEALFKKQANEYTGVLHVSTHGYCESANQYETTLTMIAPAGNYSGELAHPLFRCGLAFAGANHVWTGHDPLPNEEDGLLTGYEISQLNLLKVPLVVLSACETALGDIHKYEGVLGLQRAFFVAGADKIIISLWQVPQMETMALMTALYKHLLNGVAVHKALNLARTEMYKKNPNPYYWAGFILIE